MGDNSGSREPNPQAVSALSGFDPGRGDISELCIEAFNAVRAFERDYYSSLARANRLLIPTVVVGVVGNLLIWLALHP